MPSSSAPSSSRPSSPPSSRVSARFTVFFDGQFWVGVLEHVSVAGVSGVADGAVAHTVRAARYVFGAEPGDAELYAFLLAHGDDLIDAVESSTPVTATGRAGRIGPAVSPKRAARLAAKEAARPRPSTAAQVALAAARQEQAARGAGAEPRPPPAGG